MKTKITSLLFDKTILYFIFVIICYVGFISVHSANGDALDNWHQRGAGVTTEYLQAVVYGNGTFIAVGRNGALVSSADGGVAFGNNTVVAVGENGIILQSDPLDPNNGSQQSDGGGGGGCFIETLVVAVHGCHPGLSH